MSKISHYLRTYHWRVGRLQHTEHRFESFDAVIEMLRDYECESFKVFDADGVLVHSGNKNDVGPDYA